MAQVTVTKGRRTVLEIGLGYDISSDIITSQIRSGKSRTSPLIAEWTVLNKSDGTDGELVLVLDDSENDLVEQTVGYMDVKRISGGEPLAVFDEPLEVIFQDAITV
jgi:hypothetical protein